MQKSFCLIFCVLFSGFSFASVLCPKTFNYINTGMTLAEVKQACGQPDNISKTNKEIFGEEPVTIAVYHPTNLGVSSPELTMELSNGKISSMKVGGTDVASTNVCGERITSQSSYDNILIACGEPSYTDQATRRVSKGTAEVQVWTYVPNEFQPPVTFEFENGVLTKISK